MKYLYIILWILYSGVTSADEVSNIFTTICKRVNKRVVTQEFCGKKDINGASGSWTFKTDSNRRVTCEWNVAVEEGKVVEIQIQNYTKGRCWFLLWDVFEDVVEIDWTYSRCDKKMSDKISSSNNKLKIIYKSHTSVEFVVMFKGLKLSEAVAPYTECGQTLTGESGTFTSPGFPTGYKTRLKCTWNIIPTEVNDFIEIKFKTFSVETSSYNCRHDSVKIYDDDSDRISNLCNRCDSCTKPGKITTSGKNLTIVFVSDESITDSGFSAYYATKKEALVGNKKCVKRLKRFQKMIASPGFPNNYDNGLSCTWILTPYPNYTAFEVIFIAFDVEEHPNCLYDRLVLSENIDGWKSCGKEPISKFLVTTRHPLEIVLSTDSSVRRSGFKAFYRLTNCGGQLSSNIGSFTSPNYPFRYPQLMKCTWNISVEVGLIAEIRFTNFSLSSWQNGCDKDYLEVYVGANNTLFGRYCDLKVPNVISSPDNMMKVIFVSDSFNTVLSKGFIAAFRGTEAPRIKNGSTTEFVCGRLLKDDFGSFKSPGYPRNYFPNLNCTWIIDPKKKKPNSYIELILKDFEVERSHFGCRHDYLESSERRRICEISTFPYVYAELSETPIIVTFITDNTTERKGFLATYRQRTVPCGGALIADKGNIVSPNSGTFLPGNLKCIWTITVPEGNIVHLQVHEMGFSQRLVIFTGPENTFLNNYTGFKFPDVIWSPNNKMTVHYLNENDDTRNHEFNATFEARDPSEFPVSPECFTVLTKNSGRISQSYLFNMNCTWIIKVDPKYMIMLNFTKFDLEHSTGCKNDYLLIIQTYSVTRHCGFHSPFTVRINDNSVTLMFITDDSRNDDGFILEYKAIQVRTVIIGRLSPKSRFMWNYGLLYSGLKGTFESPRRNQLALEHIESIVNTSSDLKVKELLPLTFQHIKFITKHIGFFIVRAKKHYSRGSLDENRYSALSELFDTLNLLKVQENIRKVRAKDKANTALFTAIRSATLSALHFINDVKNVWSIMSHTTRSSRLPLDVPHIYSAKLLAAAVNLADILLDNMYLLSDNKYLHGSICEIGVRGKNCFMDEVEEIKAIRDYLVEVDKLRHQEHRLLTDNILSSLKRLGDIENILKTAIM